jgi:hypothetical protein
MNKKLLSCLIAAALGATLSLTSPVFARGGGGGGMHFGGGHFGGGHFAHGAGFSRFAYHNGFRHGFHRFGFYGAPFVYASYDGCWRRTWTPYGLQWVNICGGYGY